MTRPRASRPPGELPPRAAALCSPRAVAEILRRHGLRARKRLGQHFLVDRRVLAAIVGAAELTPADAVLEIGAGLGTLTLALAARAGRVVAIEVARELAPVLAETLAGVASAEVGHAAGGGLDRSAAGTSGEVVPVRLVFGDALRLDLARLLAEEGAGRRWKAVANLPYYATAPLLARLLGLPLDLLVLTVQKEVAERLVAAPGSHRYGALTVFVAYHAAAEVVAAVPPRSFYPPPLVASAVVRLRRRPAPPVPVPAPVLFAAVRAAFAHRRKTLANALAAELAPPGGRGTVETALARASLDAGRRPETLSLEEFARLAGALLAEGWRPARTGDARAKMEGDGGVESRSRK